jgi:hypothetical protein
MGAGLVLLERKGVDMVRIYISNARDDADFIRQMAGALERAGLEALIGSELGWQPGSVTEETTERIRTLMAHCDTLVFALTPAALDSEWVRADIAAARTLAQAGVWRNLVALIVQPITLEGFLATLAAIDVTGLSPIAAAALLYQRLSVMPGLEDWQTQAELADSPASTPRPVPPPAAEPEAPADAGESPWIRLGPPSTPPAPAPQADRSAPPAQPAPQSPVPDAPWGVPDAPPASGYGAPYPQQAPPSGGYDQPYPVPAAPPPWEAPGAQPYAPPAPSMPPAPGGMPPTRGAPPDVGSAPWVPLEAPPQRRQEQRGKAARTLQFSAYHPNTVPPATWNTLLVYTYLGEALAQIQADAGTFTELGSAPHIAQGQSGRAVAEGVELTIEPHMEGVTFSPPSETFVWRGEWHRSLFRFMGEQRLASTMQAGWVDVYAGPMVPIARIELTFPFTGPQALAPSLPPQGMIVTSNVHDNVFISYSHQDRGAFRQACEEYARFGIRVYTDEQLAAGADYERELARMIAEARVFHLLWSPASSRSGECRKEWVTALWREPTERVIKPWYWKRPLVTPPREFAQHHISFRYQRLRRELLKPWTWF